MAQERQRLEESVSARLLELEVRLDTQQRKWHDRCDRSVSMPLLRNFLKDSHKLKSAT